jgi:hypothetical protein
VIHAVDLCGIDKSLQMFSQSKDGWALFGRITPDAFKDAGTVMKDMGHNVHSRIFPTDKLSVVPHNVANARGRYIFVLATFWEHIFAPSTNEIQKLDRLPFPESENFSTYRLQKFGLDFARLFVGFGTRHNTVDSLRLARCA